MLHRALRLALGLLTLGAGCAELAALEGLPPDPRMLRATVGPGAERLAAELAREPAVLRAVEANGPPDYVFAPARATFVLLFLAADRAVPFDGPPTARRAGPPLEPIPNAWLDRVATADAEEVRARRRDGARRALVRPAGWCAEAAAPPPPRACRGEAAASALVAEIETKVLAAWRAEAPGHGGERVLVRFAVDAAGTLGARCVLGATSPATAASALAAFDAAFPVPALRGGAACLAGVPLVARLELAFE